MNALGRGRRPPPWASISGAALIWLTLAPVLVQGDENSIQQKFRVSEGSPQVASLTQFHFVYLKSPFAWRVNQLKLGLDGKALLSSVPSSHKFLA